jgi:hypothetical protein
VVVCGKAGPAKRRPAMTAIVAQAVRLIVDLQ